MVMLVLILVAAGDLGWQCYGEVGILRSVSEGGIAWQRYVITGLLGLMSLTAFIGGVICIAFLPYTVDRLIEVEQEMVKVTWPARSEVVRSTVIITIMTVVMALMIFLVDLVNYKLVVELVFQRGGISK
jgi:preprotein translocase SecE subunit